MQDYIVIEIQTNDAGKVLYYVDESGAAILAAAAVSALPVHTAVILTPYGDTIDKQAYNRITPEP